MGHEIERLLGLHQNKELLNIFATKDIYKELSFYGRKSVSEMIAEGWAEYSTSKTPRPIAKEIGEIIEKEYEKWKNR